MSVDRHRLIESSDVIPMFPTLVWKLQIEPGLRDALSSDIVATLAALRRGLPALAPGQGWQSEQTLHQRAQLRRLVDAHRAWRPEHPAFPAH